MFDTELKKEFKTTFCDLYKINKKGVSRLFKIAKDLVDPVIRDGLVKAEESVRNFSEAFEFDDSSCCCKSCSCKNNKDKY